MERYDKYKDSGIEWIGVIPEHWAVIPIKRLVGGEDTIFIDGDWIESKDIVFDSDEIRYITTGNIGEGKYKEQGLGYITEDTFQKLKCTEVFEGDLLISRLNNPIGRACIIPNLGKKIVTSVDNVILRPQKQYCKNFLKYVMSNPKYFEHTSLIARGATMQRISRGLLGEIKIPITIDFSEQNRIVEYLDSKTAQIDRIIANKQRLIAHYEEEKQAIVNQAVTKGLDPNVPMKPSGVEWLGDIPEHWEVKRLKHVSQIINGFAFNSNDFVENGIQLIKISNLYLNKFDLERQPTFMPDKFLEDYSSWIVDYGDILMSMTGTLGKRDYGYAVQVECDGPFLLNQRVSKVIFNPTLILPEFGIHILRSEYFLSSLFLEPSGTKQGNFSAEQVYKQYILCPSIAEQKLITEKVKDGLRRIDSLIEKYNKQIELFQEYRTTLISEVVTGKVKVPTNS